MSNEKRTMLVEVESNNSVRMEDLEAAIREWNEDFTIGCYDATDRYVSKERVKEVLEEEYTITKTTRNDDYTEGFKHGAEYCQQRNRESLLNDTGEGDAQPEKLIPAPEQTQSLLLTWQDKRTPDNLLCQIAMAVEGIEIETLPLPDAQQEVKETMRCGKCGGRILETTHNLTADRWSGLCYECLRMVGSYSTEAEAIESLKGGK